ncbi:MAG: hypothetical protein ACR2Q4_15600 [Geminicoccaceae bacterium]
MAGLFVSDYGCQASNQHGNKISLDQPGKIKTARCGSPFICSNATSCRGSCARESKNVSAVDLGKNIDLQEMFDKQHEIEGVDGAEVALEIDAKDHVDGQYGGALDADHQRQRERRHHVQRRTSSNIGPR